jgi:hypothetical protein
MIKIKKDDIAPESAELLARSIIEVADASKQLVEGGLSMRALIVLLQDCIGESRISKSQIKLVLENLPRLKGWYCREAK